MSEANTPDSVADAPLLRPGQLGLPALSTLLEASGEGVSIADEYGCFVYANPCACAIYGYPLSELVGRDVLFNLSVEDRQRLAPGLDERAHGKPERGLATLVQPSGEQRTVEFSIMGLDVGGQTYTACIMHDVTASRRLEREGVALMQIASRVAYGGSLEATMNGLCEHLVGVSGAVASSVILVEPGSDQLRMVGMYGLPEGYPEGFNKMIAAGVRLQSLAVLQDGEHRVLRNSRENMLKMPNYVPLHHFIRTVAWDTIVALPLIYGGERKGLLLNYQLPTRLIDDALITLLKAIANQAAVAVENARLLSQVHEKAALEERQRLARELHDSVSQALYSISLQARAARILYDRDTARVQEPLEAVLALSKAAMAEMRALIFELRPGALREEGLLEAIRKHASGLAARHSLPVEVIVEGDPLPRLKPAAEEALYRVSQEALHNVVKHARASSASVLVRLMGDDLTLSIADDGQGFDPAQVPAGHMGLGTMGQRAAALNGEYTVTSAPGHGTTVKVEVSLADWREAI